MKTHPFHIRRRGFTLIELLVVITIIVILAGLSMGGFSFVTRKQAEEQARVQIALLEKALEEYKLDNGAYPGPPPESPNANFTSNDLYKELYWNGVSGNGKIYLADLDPNSKGQGWIEGTGANATIRDPWGNEYIYRRGDNSAAKNPDFDLASKGKDGKTNDSNPDAPENRDDIDNF